MTFVDERGGDCGGAVMAMPLVLCSAFSCPASDAGRTVASSTSSCGCNKASATGVEYDSMRGSLQILHQSKMRMTNVLTYRMRRRSIDAFRSSRCGIVTSRRFHYVAWVDDNSKIPVHATSFQLEGPTNDSKLTFHLSER